MVDDDPAMHEGLRFILGSQYDLTCVFSGEEALEATSKEVYPVVLLDLYMEGLSGLETLKHLLKEENEPQKIIILTGNDTKDSAIQALNLGAFRYLMKPFQKEELESALQSAFHRYHRETGIARGPAKLSLEYLQVQGLSQRQSEIALLSIQGASNREIGKQLKISERTVEKHMQGIFSLMKVNSRAKLVVRSHSVGVV